MGPIVGAQAVVVDRRNRVLLQLRGWPPGWEPPGGHVGPGEDPLLTVVRETREECGLEIEVDRLIGHYHFRGIRLGTDAVYVAHPVGGRLHPTKEALRLLWASPERLPRAIFPWYRQRILDAVGPVAPEPFERWQPVDLGHVLRHGAALTAELGSAAGSRVVTRRRP
ncbi:MAG: NUDIX hydrolase [Candidatus Dormibacteria bacterium]